MRTFRTLSRIILGAALVLGIAGSAFAQEDPVYDRVMKDKKLRVFAIQYAPQSYRDSTGEEWKGFDADVYRYIAKQLGVTAEPVFGAIAAFGPTITSGRAEMGIALFRSPEREQLADFTAPYKWVSEHVFVAESDTTTTSPEGLKSKVVGVPRGSASERAALTMQSEGHVKEVRQYESADAMVLDLKIGRVDAIVAQMLYFQWMQKQNPDMKARGAFEMNPKYYNQTGRTPSQFPIAKGAPKLLAAVNRIIDDMRANGEFARIFAAYGITDPIIWTPPK